MLKTATGKEKRDILEALKALGERNKQKGRGGKREPKTPPAGLLQSQVNSERNDSAVFLEIGDFIILGPSLSDLELVRDGDQFLNLDAERARLCGTGVPCFF